MDSRRGPREEAVDSSEAAQVRASGVIELNWGILGVVLGRKDNAFLATQAGGAGGGSSRIAAAASATTLLSGVWGDGDGLIGLEWNF